jgi:hypothetical protein
MVKRGRLQMRNNKILEHPYKSMQIGPLLVVSSETRMFERSMPGYSEYGI